MLLQARVIKGHQVASGNAKNSPFPDSTIAMQKPYFSEQGLDLSSMFNGTINAEITQLSKIELMKSDYYFKDIKWCKNFKPESFLFVKCTVIFKGKELSAFIYQPDKKTKIAHHQPDNTLEILAPLIPELKYGKEFQISIDEGYLSFYP